MTACANSFCTGSVGEDRLRALREGAQNPLLVSQYQTTLGSADEHAHRPAIRSERPRPLCHTRHVLQHSWGESCHHLCLDPDLREAAGFVLEQHSQVMFWAPAAAVRTQRISCKAAQKPFSQLQRTQEKSCQGGILTTALDDGVEEVKQTRVLAYDFALKIIEIPAKPQVPVNLDKHGAPTSQTGGCVTVLKHMAAGGCEP